MNKNQHRAAFVCFGEVNSPRELLLEMREKSLQELKSCGLSLVTTELVTDDAAGEEVRSALEQLKGEDFDLLIVCVAGWIPSHAVIAITDAYRNLPMVLWGLAGEITNGRVVTTAAQAGTTALRKVFGDLGYRFKYLYNIINQPSPLNEIFSYAQAAFACKEMRSTKVGMMGYRDMNLYNTLYEGISLKKITGTEIAFFETLEMLQQVENNNPEEAAALLNKIQSNWHFEKPVDPAFLNKGVNYFLALRKIVQENGFDAISLKDVDGMKKLLGFPPAMVFMLLADELGVCTIPENDAMGSVTQLIIKALTGQCAAYLEFYEFFESSLLMGVPDYVPAEVVDGKVTITTAAFGNISGGLLNISRMKTGLVTLARLSNTGSTYSMHVSKGTARLRAWEEAGWTQPAPQLPSLEIELSGSVKEFAGHISGQHYIIAYGDHVQAIIDYCAINKIDVIQ
jgi:L-fucose isomerase-like protein